MLAPTAAPSNAARGPHRALRHLLRSGPIAAACCTSFGLAHAEDSAHIFANANANANADFDADTQAHALMAGAEPVAEAQPNPAQRWLASQRRGGPGGRRGQHGRWPVARRR